VAVSQKELRVAQMVSIVMQIKIAIKHVDASHMGTNAAVISMKVKLNVPLMKSAQTAMVGVSLMVQHVAPMVIIAMLGKFVVEPPVCLWVVLAAEIVHVHGARKNIFAQAAALVAFPLMQHAALAPLMQLYPTVRWAKSAQAAMQDALTIMSSAAMIMMNIFALLVKTAKVVLEVAYHMVHNAAYIHPINSALLDKAAHHVAALSPVSVAVFLIHNITVFVIRPVQRGAALIDAHPSAAHAVELDIK
jgi:hypothetical protein